MISFLTVLTESMNVGYPYTFIGVIRGDEGYKYEFTDGQHKYGVYFDKHTIHTYEIIFHTNGSIYRTKVANPLRVFATVANIAREVHQKHPDRGFFFSSEDEDLARIKLYHQLAKRLAKEINGTVKFGRDRVQTIVYWMITK